MKLSIPTIIIMVEEIAEEFADNFKIYLQEIKMALGIIAGMASMGFMLAILIKLTA